MRSTGFESYKKSFQNFFERIFSPVLRDLSCVKKLEEILKKQPFNAGFGMYLYTKNAEVNGIFPQSDIILRDILSVGLRDFDVYHITEGITEDMRPEIEEIQHKVSEKVRATYHKFIKEFMKVYEKRSKVEDSVLKLLKAVNANNILQVKKLAG